MNRAEKIRILKRTIERDLATFERKISAAKTDYSPKLSNFKYDKDKKELTRAWKKITEVRVILDELRRAEITL